MDIALWGVFRRAQFCLSGATVIEDVRVIDKRVDRSVVSASIVTVGPKEPITASRIWSVPEDFDKYKQLAPKGNAWLRDWKFSSWVSTPLAQKKYRGRRSSKYFMT